MVQDHGQFSECGTIVSGPRTALVVGSFLTVAPKDFPTIVIIVIVIVVDSSAITVRPWCPCAEGAEIQHITPSVRECFFFLFWLHFPRLAGVAARVQQSVDLLQGPRGLQRLSSAIHYPRTAHHPPTPHTSFPPADVSREAAGTMWKCHWRILQGRHLGTRLRPLCTSRVKNQFKTRCLGLRLDELLNDA